jgi:N-acetylneuraminate synthase
MPGFKIENRYVGDDATPLVIVEIGINHEGSLDVAKEMVDAAARAGAEVVKHQTHIVEDEMSGAAKKVIPGNTDVSIYEVMERCALNEADETELKAYIESRGMTFISTPFSRAALERLERMGCSAYKIGSGECNNYPLVELVAKTKKPVILSTGMNSIESIAKSVDIFRKYDVPFALLHCTNIYPTPFDKVRLGAIADLREAFPDAVLGLSDHSLSNNPCLGSIALGGSIVERHFTDHMERPGPDIVCSMDEAALSSLLVGVKEMYECRGGTKGILDGEQVTIDFAYATVVTIDKIKKGEMLTENNIWVKRPGIGEILAENYSELLGRRVKSDLDKDVHLSWDDINDD